MDEGSYLMSHFNSGHVKLLALTLMLADHAAAIFMAPGCTGYSVLRLIGRLSFPLYAHLAAEGISHTSSRIRYAMRLMLLAAVSEIPYDLAFAGTPCAWGSQNIFVTMALAVTAFSLPCRGARGRAAWILAAGLAAGALRADYGFLGVALIASLYSLRGREGLRSGAAAAFLYAQAGSLGLGEAGTVIGTLLLSGAWVSAVTAAGGKAGGKRWRPLFYASYPAHLLCFWAVKALMSG